MAGKVDINGKQYILLPSAFLDQLFNKVVADYYPLRRWKEEEEKLNKVRELAKNIIEFSADNGYYPNTDEIPITQEILVWLQEQYNIQTSPF